MLQHPQLHQQQQLQQYSQQQSLQQQPQQQQQQQPQVPAETSEDAPPKQVAMAMDRLGQASRLIADIRIGADRLLEALFVSAESYQPQKTANLIVKEESAMRVHLQDLRNIGRQLESSGVLNDALRSRSNSWGLHMPLVCPDGAVVAYAWKRQLAGQAGASAVDRTRLALKSFADQKRRFFPHLDCESSSKKQCVSQESLVENPEESSNYRTLTDTLESLEKEVPDMKIYTYERLEWLKRASSLPASANEDAFNTSMAQAYHGPSSLRPESPHVSSDKVAVVELFIPSVFRAVVSLHPVGSTDPDAVAFFSPDEGGSHVHARGSSLYNAYRHITEFSNIALQHFLGNKSEMALYLLLHWISGYQNLFTQACSKCERIISMDRQSALLLPPVHRPYQNLLAAKAASGLLKDQTSNTGQVYHVSCSPPDV
ncbi:mediator of RNA polymerase II transcription subunit 27-like [Chenopodium quinoa]|uniref:mediator of RNA polymerase II transcription subunit 27-like n=1 Tax=Chenopodium quinoa TaxID=63459 RepID=UPI000B772599|nr:mediator of RNA polymerase II transcription subunit 27-like [Chenopodium quinoa]